MISVVHVREAKDGTAHLLCSTFITTSEEISFTSEEAEKCVYQLLKENTIKDLDSIANTLFEYCDCSKTLEGCWKNTLDLLVLLQQEIASDFSIWLMY